MLYLTTRKPDKTTPIHKIRWISHQKILQGPTQIHYDKEWLEDIATVKMTRKKPASIPTQDLPQHILKRMKDYKERESLVILDNG